MARRLLFDGALQELGQLPLEGMDVLTATVSLTTDAASLIATATVLVQGQQTSSLSSSISATATVLVQGESSNNLQSGTVSAIATATILATLSNNLDSLTGLSEGSVDITASCVVSLDTSTCLSFGEVLPIVDGTLTATTDSVGVAATAVVAVVGTSVVSTSLLNLVADIDVLVQASLTVSLENATQNALATVATQAVVEGTLATVQLTAFGNLTITGGLVYTLNMGSPSIIGVVPRVQTGPASGYPVRTQPGVSFVAKGLVRYYVWTGTEFFGPVTYAEADAHARYISQENAQRAAEVLTLSRGVLFVDAYYLAGRKLLSGSVAKANSRRVFG